MSEATEPLWRPDAQRVASSQVMAFIAEANRRHGTDLKNYRELHAWSVVQGADFWNLVWDFCGIIGDKGERRLLNADKMPGAQFFPDASLNFAENLLRAAGSGDALIFRGEDKISYRLSWAELIALVSRLQQALRGCGVGKGDRITAMIPNMPETIALMLAVTSLGAICSTCSPDFGERAVLDRFGQIEPKVFVTVDGYWYNGKPIGIVDKVAAVAKQLVTAETVVIIPYLGDAAKAADQVPRARSLEDFLKRHTPKPLTFERLPFNHPVEILYSSGTTGVPKCIVHSAGGMLLQHSKEHRLQCDLRAGERLFYFTTCGCMMWNWLASGIGSGATLVLFDGSPFAPQTVLWDYAQDERINVFGTSAKYIDACKKAGLAPARTHDLSSMRVITSTGSPLAPESFDYVYSDIRADVHLASISGGTDIATCRICAFSRHRERLALRLGDCMAHQRLNPLH